MVVQVPLGHLLTYVLTGRRLAEPHEAANYGCSQGNGAVTSVESALRRAAADLNAVGVRWALVGGLAAGLPLGSRPDWPTIRAKITSMLSPPSGRGWALIAAPCAFAMAATMDRPKPDPPGSPARSGLSRWKG